MNDGSWVLSGVDAETRDRAVEEAARLGMSVADYLTDILLQGAHAAAPDAAPDAGAQAQLPESSDEFAVRHRLQALKRRLGAAADSIGEAIDAFDLSVVDIAGRVGEIEARAGEAAQSLQHAGAEMAVIRSHLSTLEAAAAAQGEANEAAHADLAAACVGLGRRVDTVEASAQKAEEAAAALGRQQKALERAVAQDFVTFAQETAARLDGGLNEVRAAADAAAAQADAAAAHVVREMSGLRQSLEGRLAESAAESRARMQAAFAETADRLAALSARVAENERAHARDGEHLRAQIADVEDSAQSALEETAETLRRADAAMAGNLARAQQDARDALGAVRALADDVAGLQEQHAAGMAQLKQASAAAAEASETASGLRQALERRIAAVSSEARANLSNAQADWDERFDALAARVDADASDAAEVRRVLRAETERVEACTLAALEKLSGDIASGDAALEARLQHVGRAAEAGVERLGRRLDDDVESLRDQHAETAAGLDVLNRAVAALEASATPVNERLVRLERSQARAEMEQAAILALAERVGALEHGQAGGFEALRAEIARFVAANDTRLTALETGAAAIDVDDVVGQFAALRTRIEERIAAVEQRSVRMLEQVAETVMLLDKRLGGASEQASARSA